MLWVGLQLAIVVFPDHTHFLYTHGLVTYQGVTCKNFQIKMKIVSILNTRCLRRMESLDEIDIVLEKKCSTIIK